MVNMYNGCNQKQKIAISTVINMKYIQFKNTTLLAKSFILLGFLLSSFTVNSAEEFTNEHSKWLTEQFSEQHQALLPVVAVADMFYACNKSKKVEQTSYQLSDLVTKMDKNELANKLTHCLGDDDIKSDVAMNYGLEGCFDEQLSALPPTEKQEKMVLVKKAIMSLSRIERQKSFTKCVNAQAMHYLK